MYNIDHKTGISYGVIPMHDIMRAWCDSSEGVYPTPYDCWAECICDECGERISIPENASWGDTIDCDNVVDCGTDDGEIEEDCTGSGTIHDGDNLEPSHHEYTNDDYICRQRNDDCDIFVCKSPYYTYAPLCSPCAPGARYLRNSEGNETSGEKCYCFGHEWFWDSDEKKAPYRVYSVETDKEHIAPITLEKADTALLCALFDCADERALLENETFKKYAKK